MVITTSVKVVVGSESYADAGAQNSRGDSYTNKNFQLSISLSTKGNRKQSHNFYYEFLSLTEKMMQKVLEHCLTFLFLPKDCRADQCDVSCLSNRIIYKNKPPTEK